MYLAAPTGIAPGPPGRVDACRNWHVVCCGRRRQPASPTRNDPAAAELCATGARDGPVAGGGHGALHRAQPVW